ncbi:MAG: hypothetical protein WEC75_06935 [Dehalococcoidia bacterium]
MSTDFDERLRAWLDDGDDVLPDLYLNAALEQVARLAQRNTRSAAVRRYLPMSGLARTVNSGARLVAAVAAVAIVAIAAAVALTTAGLPIGFLGSSPHFMPDDLESIVLSPFDPPDGATHTTTLRDVEALVDAVGADTATWRAVERSGYIDSRAEVFASSEFSLPDGAGRSVTSWAAVFGTSADASDALGIIRAWSEKWHPSLTSYARWGDGGISFEEMPSPWAPPDAADWGEAGLLWRYGNLLMYVHAWGDYDAGELELLAQGMQTGADQ